MCKQVSVTVTVHKTPHASPDPSTVNLTPTPLSKTFSYDPIGVTGAADPLRFSTWPTTGLIRPTSDLVEAGNTAILVEHDMSGTTVQSPAGRSSRFRANFFLAAPAANVL